MLVNRVVTTSASVMSAIIEGPDFGKSSRNDFRERPLKCFSWGGREPPKTPKKGSGRLLGPSERSNRGRVSKSCSPGFTESSPDMPHCTRPIPFLKEGPRPCQTLLAEGPSWGLEAGAPPRETPVLGGQRPTRDYLAGRGT